MYNLTINPEAFDDVAEAYDHYQEIAGEKVAETFFSELDKAYSKLKIDPYYQTRSGKYKGFPLNRFPFILFFEVLEIEKQIKVLAVFNTYRDPAKWPK